MPSEATYPQREKFFALRFTRLMTKRCLAQEAGHLSTWLLTVIVHQEDAAHYRRGVTFYDGQLMPLLGINSKKSMTATRKKLVESGWLHFEPGHKGKASTYWVLIPKEADGLDDLPTDEGLEGFGSLKEPHSGDSVPFGNRKGTRSGTERGPDGEPNGGHYIPIPIPNPGAQPESDFHEQAKPRVLSERFIFHWSERAARGRTPRSAIEIEPQFAEHLRRFPDHFTCILTEIDSSNRNRNEWPDKLLARFESRNGAHRPPAPSLPDANVLHAQKLAEFEAAKQAEAAKQREVA